MNHQKFSPYNFITQNSGISYLVMGGVLLAGFFIAQFGSVVAAGILHGFNFSDVFSILSPPFTDASYRNTLLIAQGVNSAILFIVTPLFYLYFYERVRPQRVFSTEDRLNWQIVILTVVLVIVYMPISAYSAFWNESIQIPGSFGDFARAMEDQLKELTLFMVSFDSLPQFLLGLFIIAVIPGIGEELLFRGILQNKIEKASGNMHLAIWSTALIFSAFHLQFYGFIPRMLLGGLFGYLYVWSGTLLVPIFSAFCK
ncbi:MAG: CPBP family intramembrane glutamic endopeptidase [Bacteroidota bacterium]